MSRSLQAFFVPPSFVSLTLDRYIRILDTGLLQILPQASNCAKINVASPSFHKLLPRLTLLCLDYHMLMRNAFHSRCSPILAIVPLNCLYPVAVRTNPDNRTEQQKRWWNPSGDVSGWIRTTDALATSIAGSIGDGSGMADGDFLALNFLLNWHAEAVTII